MRILITSIVCLMATISTMNVFAQTYTNINNIFDMVTQGDYLWCATKGGVVRWNICDMTYKIFTNIIKYYKIW